MKRAEGICNEVFVFKAYICTQRVRTHSLALVRRVRADGVMAYEFGLAPGRDLLARDALSARAHRRRVTDRTRSPPEALSLGVVTFLTHVSSFQALQVPCGIVGAERAGRQEEGWGRRFHQDDILMNVNVIT